MRPQIVLFGDSITQHSFGSGGWGAAIAHAYSRKADVVLRGYSGYNSRWALFLLSHIFAPGLAASPIAVTIFFGANDAALLEGTGRRQHVPLKEYEDNLRKMVEHIKKCSSNTLVVLITPPPIDEVGRREFARVRYGDMASDEPDRTNEITGKYAQHCLALAKELGLPSVNLWSIMQKTDGWQKKFLSDGLHLTSEGNAVVSQEVIKIFDGAGFADLPYDFPMHSDIDEEDPGKTFAHHFTSA